MSIFGKWPPRVEIFIHHHLFGIRPANLAVEGLLPLCSYFIYTMMSRATHYGKEYINVCSDRRMAKRV